MKWSFTKIFYFILLIAQIISFFYLLRFKTYIDNIKDEKCKNKDISEAFDKTRSMINYTLIFMVIWIILLGVYLLWI
jgi:hypothetical protein